MNLAVVCESGSGNGQSGSVIFPSVKPGDGLVVIFTNANFVSVLHPAWVTHEGGGAGGKYYATFEATITSPTPLTFTWTANSADTGDYHYTYTRMCVRDDWILLGNFADGIYQGDENILAHDCIPHSGGGVDSGVFSIGNYRRARVILDNTALVMNSYIARCGSLPSIPNYCPNGGKQLLLETITLGPLLSGLKEKRDCGWIYGDIHHSSGGLPPYPGISFSLGGSVYVLPEDEIELDPVPPDDGGGGDGGGTDPDDGSPVGGVSVTAATVANNRVSSCGGFGVHVQSLIGLTVASNVVSNCGIGISALGVIRGVVVANQVENAAFECVLLKQSNDNLVAGNITGNPSIQSPGDYAHYWLVDSERNTLTANKTLRTTRLAAAAVVLDADCVDNGVVFNDFRGIVLPEGAEIVDDNASGGTKTYWNLPFDDVEDIIRAVIGAMFQDSGTIDVTFDDEASTVTLDVIPGTVDADTVDGLHVDDLLDKATYDSDDDGVVEHAVLADSVPWSGVTGAPATYPPDVHVHALDDLSDVQASAPVEGQILVFTAGAWRSVTAGSLELAELVDDADLALVDDADAVLLGDVWVLEASAGSSLRRHVEVIGDGELLVFEISHGFGVREVVVTVLDATTYQQVIADVVLTDLNTVSVAFDDPPASGAYRVVVIG